MTRHHDHGHDSGELDWSKLGPHLELEGEVLAPYLDEALSVLQTLVSASPEVIRRIVDIGCGPGVATTALALAFPDANLIALDGEPALLARVSDRAHRLGVGHRVTTVRTDLEAGLGTLGPVDLAWSGMALHHLEDPARLIRELHATLSPGGLMAIAEFGPPTPTLPDEPGFSTPGFALTWGSGTTVRFATDDSSLATPGFARRHAEALADAPRSPLPPGALHTDWPDMLQTIGFEMIEQRTILVDLPAPLTEPARRWVVKWIELGVSMMHERISADDQATLAILLDPTDPRGVMHRTDVDVHVSRSLYVARKPRR